MPRAEAVTARGDLLALLRAGGRVDGRRAADWEGLVTEACGEGLGPWLHRTLRESGDLEALPPAAAVALRAHARAVVARNLLLSDELVDVLRACRRHDVPCVPVRGPALAEDLYGDIAARPAGDLDLLVGRGDLPGVRRALTELGFRELEHRRGFATAFSYALTFVKPRHGWVVVEPHWSLAYPPFVDDVPVESVWADCRPARVLGVESLRLSPEALLVHLGLHLLHPEGGPPLLWAWELDRLVRREGDALDWRRVLAIAARPGPAWLLARALALVCAGLDTPVPPEAHAALARGGEAVDPRLRAVLGRPGLRGREELATFLALRGARPRLRYALGLLFPSPAFLALREAGVPATAYLRRAGRLAWSATRAVARAARA